MLYEKVLDTFGPSPGLLKAIRFEVGRSVAQVVMERLAAADARAENFGFQMPAFDFTWWEAAVADLYGEQEAYSAARMGCLIDEERKRASVFVSHRTGRIFGAPYETFWEGYRLNERRSIHDLVPGVTAQTCFSWARVFMETSNYLNDRPDEVDVEGCDGRGRRVGSSAPDRGVIYKKLTLNLGVRSVGAATAPTRTGVMPLHEVMGYWRPRTGPNRRRVRAYVRGDARNGIVIKDYALVLDQASL